MFEIVIASVAMGVIIVSILATFYVGIRPEKSKIEEFIHMANVLFEGGVAYGSIFGSGVRTTRIVGCGLALFTSLGSSLCVGREVWTDVFKKRPMMIRATQVDRGFLGTKQHIGFVTIEHCIKIVASLLQSVVRVTEIILRSQRSTSQWKNIDRYFSIYPILLALLSWTGRIASKPTKKPSSISCLLLGEIEKTDAENVNPRSPPISHPHPLPKLLEVIGENVIHSTLDMWTLNLAVKSKEIQFNMWEVREDISNMTPSWKLPAFDLIMIQYDKFVPSDFEDTIARKWKPFLDTHAKDVPRILVTFKAIGDPVEIEALEATGYGLAYVDCNIRKEQTVRNFLEKIWMLYLATK